GFTAAMALLIVPNLTHLFPAGYQDLDMKLWTPEYLAQSGFETTTSGELRPRWMQTLPPYQPAPRLVSGEGSVQNGRVAMRTAGVVELPTAYFPGWVVRVDGGSAPADPAPSTGLIRFGVAPGEHRFDATFERTPARWVGDVCSVLASIA